MHFRSAAQAIRATRILSRGVLGRTVSREDVAMVQWEHHQRLGQAVRRRESGVEKDIGIERESGLERLQLAARSFRSYLTTEE